jgi:hypothetical protein
MGEDVRILRSKAMRSVRRFIQATPAVLLAALLLPVAPAEADSKNLRSSFPGRRIGGGTRGECTGRLLAHLVPENSVYAPGGSALLGILEGPALKPMPVEASFRPYRQGGDVAETSPGVKRDLPAVPAGITLFRAAAIDGPTVWESHYLCAPESASTDPLDFVVTTAPPVVSLLLAEEQPAAADEAVRVALLRLHDRCGSMVSRSEVAQAFGLEDLLARGWPEQLPVRCP